MKTARLIIFTASILLAGQIHCQPRTGSCDIRVPLEKAMFDPQMAKAILDQVDPHLLAGEVTGYAARITYLRHTYIIYGTKETWEILFTMGPKTSHAWSKALL